MERRGEHMERRGEHMERHVGMARGRPHVARGWREWRQSSRDGGALLPRRRRLRTVRAAGSARRYFFYASGTTDRDGPRAAPCSRLRRSPFRLQIHCYK